MYRPRESPEEASVQVSLWKNPLPKTYTANLPSVPRKGHRATYQCDCALGRGKQTFQGFPKHWSWTDAISQLPKSHCSIPFRGGAHGGQAINEVLAQGPSHNESSVSQTYTVVLFSIVECKHEIETRYFQNSCIGSLPYQVRASMVGKAMWKSLKLPLPVKIMNQKQCCIPGVSAGISASIMVWTDPGIVIPTTSPFKWLIWPVQKICGS